MAGLVVAAAAAAQEAGSDGDPLKSPACAEALAVLNAAREGGRPAADPRLTRGDLRVTVQPAVERLRYIDVAVLVGYLLCRYVVTSKLGRVLLAIRDQYGQTDSGITQ